MVLHLALVLARLAGQLVPRAEAPDADARAAKEAAEAAAAAKDKTVPPVKVADTEVVMTQVVQPSQVDELGVVHGGQVLSWIDIAAGISSKIAARNQTVTASMDTVSFLRPSRRGDVVMVKDMVNRAFRTSMEVGVRVEAECMKTGERRHCCSAFLTFVAIDKEGRAQPVAPVEPETPRERARHARALERRQLRLAERKKTDGLLNSPSILPVVLWHHADPPYVTPCHFALPAGEDGNRRKPVDETVAHMTQLVLPSDANTVGVTFGGQICAWMETCAYIAASRLCRNVNFLTAAVDALFFIRPTRVGDIVYISGKVTRTFNTSMEVAVSVWAENPFSSEVRHCNDAFFIVVGVDNNEEPVHVPYDVTPISKADLTRYEQSAVRRRARLSMRRHVSRLSSSLSEPAESDAGAR